MLSRKSVDSLAASRPDVELDCKAWTYLKEDGWAPKDQAKHIEDRIVGSPRRAVRFQRSGYHTSICLLYIMYLVLVSLRLKIQVFVGSLDNATESDRYRSMLPRPA